YLDGQHWDDSNFTIPAGATTAAVTVYHQTSSRKYMEFLRDTNATNAAGQNAHNLWVATGRSAPVVMDTATLSLTSTLLGDLNNDGIVNAQDLATLLNNWGSAGLGDLDNNGQVDAADLSILLNGWTG
ncbi:MAG: hypothetical protein DWI20_00325, partial [Planctomycetota bacterium]